MAGIYPDIPGTRFALDQDGTILKWRDYTTSSSWTDISASIAETQKVNSANYASSGIGNSDIAQFVFAFPEARTISGIYLHGGTPSNGSSQMLSVTWEFSTNTTDGTDGTWTSMTVTFTNFSQHGFLSSTSKPYYRSDIATVALNNVRGIRLRWNQSGGWGGESICVFHLYGTRPTTGVDRLAFWHPSTDQAIGAADLDFGDIAQGTSMTKQFRIKNISGTLTANSITLQVSDLLPEYTGTGLQVSTDNVTYQNSVNIGNLASGIISPTLYVRRTVPGAETTTQRQARLLAHAASWT
jgi:hypothetical protein